MDPWDGGMGLWPVQRLGGSVWESSVPLAANLGLILAGIHQMGEIR